MGFTVTTVKRCPVTENSAGVVRMAPELIATIAGAVRDDIEWIALLVGKRSEDGLEVEVTDFLIPKQHRSAAEAQLIEMDLPDNVVGVMHSHHTMGAFFSGTDTSELNPRFPLSIVVAVSSTSSFGFSYQAEGKMVLPCGSVGQVAFTISVNGVDGFEYDPVAATHEGLVDGLMQCPHTAAVDGEYTRKVTAPCGLYTTAEKPLAFGLNGAEFLASVQANTQHRGGGQQRPSYNGNYGGNYGYGGFGVNRYGYTYVDDQYEYEYNRNGRKNKGTNRKGKHSNQTSYRMVQNKCDLCEQFRLLEWEAASRLWLCPQCYEKWEDMPASQARAIGEAIREMDNEPKVTDALADSTPLAEGTDYLDDGGVVVSEDLPH